MTRNIYLLLLLFFPLKTCNYWNFISDQIIKHNKIQTSGNSSVSKECRSSKPGLNSLCETWSSPCFLMLDDRDTIGSVDASGDRSLPLLWLCLFNLDPYNSKSCNHSSPGSEKTKQYSIVRWRKGKNHLWETGGLQPFRGGVGEVAVRVLTLVLHRRIRSRHLSPHHIHLRLAICNLHRPYKLQ